MTSKKKVKPMKALMPIQRKPVGDKETEQDPYLEGITKRLKKIVEPNKELVTGLAALSEAVRKSAEQMSKDRAAEKQRRLVQPAFFIIRPYDRLSFFGGYKYRASTSTFEPIWFCFNGGGE